VIQRVEADDMFPAHAQIKSEIGHIGESDWKINQTFVPQK
jgi:hypothetical protein